jgi:hypothetical protein
MMGERQVQQEALFADQECKSWGCVCNGSGTIYLPIRLGRG